MANTTIPSLIEHIPTSKKQEQVFVRVGLASCGLAAGARTIYDELVKELHPHNIEVRSTGCIGMCHAEPLVEVVRPGDDTRYIYGPVTPAKVRKIVTEHVLGGKPIAEWLVTSDIAPRPDIIQRQTRIVLANCGTIDAESITDYIAAGGYQAIKKAFKMMPDQVIEEVTKAGLRGRGGAGFRTGLKWSLTRKTQAAKRFIVCNADEGDPGAFMDRSVLEGDPHGVIEGMLIGAYAMGASQGFLYVRAEYPLAVKRVRKAVMMAEEYGFLGNNILGSGFDCHLSIREGAGAFVCGEETALMQSIEGKRGMPTPRPPFPSEKGLWGYPTSINNVETFANVPYILREGWEKFASLGTQTSKGTKVFALAGNVVRGGLVEVPMGTTIKEIIFDIGGGIPDGRSLKAIQTGGPSGGCIPASMADLPVDYESLTNAGAIMGSGGLLVMDDSTCMVDVAKFFLGFTVEESCGKCTFCRVGTREMYKILDRITKGEGREEDIPLLEDIALKVKKASLCGLGQTAPNPVLTTLRYFKDEYEVHVREKRCPAKKCTALISYHVIPEACKGCGLCARQCPTGAISGELRKPHVINQETCIRCGLCTNACKFSAIKVE